MAAKKSKGCGCIKKVNKLLKPRGYAVHHTIGFTGAPPVAILNLVKIEDSATRKGPTVLAATYCPFCGKKYPDML